jgi:hypothetical protein
MWLSWLLTTLSYLVAVLGYTWWTARHAPAPRAASVGGS